MDELAQARAFTLQVAERLFLAAEVISIKAERKKSNPIQTPGKFLSTMMENTMIKSKELTDPSSCLSKAKDDELLFVLLARDKAAPVAIRAWIAERLRLGKNQVDDAQILEAEQCARLMESNNGNSRTP